ncbi:hypothetical protein M3210_19505 [Oceanobacillus luteolus]|uniref:hypothetical protein n=1 Tax=Oceanobacillus luteolus TaxID=1274358 RepID=UPI002040E119|nr:hypothetical protein [Oceanobacillus luteolus]MCM3742397.1 hypothetical protein [Oceanobacillus luteolus]
MGISKEQVDSILGVDVKVRYRTQKNEFQDLNKQFLKPIIHREIYGEKIYVPLNLWDR